MDLVLRCQSLLIYTTLKKPLCVVCNPRFSGYVQVNISDLLLESIGRMRASWRHGIVGRRKWSWQYSKSEGRQCHAACCSRDMGLVLQSIDVVISCLQPNKKPGCWNSAGRLLFSCLPFLVQLCQRRKTPLPIKRARRSWTCNYVAASLGLPEQSGKHWHGLGAALPISVNLYNFEETPLCGLQSTIFRIRPSEHKRLTIGIYWTHTGFLETRHSRQTEMILEIFQIRGKTMSCCSRDMGLVLQSMLSYLVCNQTRNRVVEIQRGGCYFLASLFGSTVPEKKDAFAH